MHDIINQLQEICEKEEIKIEEEALYTIAKKADGSMRDALSLMDQVFAYGSADIKTEDVLSIFGIIPFDVYNDLMIAINEKKSKQMLQLLHSILETGSDIQEFINGLLDYLRYLMLLKLELDVEEITLAQQEIMKTIAESFSENDILYIMSLLIKTKTDIKNSINPLLIAEMSFLKLSKLDEMKSVQSLLETIQKQPAAILDNSALHLKRTERKLHLKAEKQKDKIIEEIQTEKPKYERLEETIVKEDFPQLLEKIKQIKPIVANYFKICSIKTVEDNKIIFSSSSNTQFTRLKEEAKFLSDLFTNHYHLHVKVDFDFDKKSHTTFLRNPTIDDLKEKSPALADFIKTLDPEATIVSESYY
jgi:DNA polymerase-3 subunit gamma/tau